MQNQLQEAINIAVKLLNDHANEEFVSKSDAKKAADLLSSIQNVDTQAAVATLTKAWQDDPSFKMGWQANIAMQFQDSYEREKLANPDQAVNIHKVSNEAAVLFLDLLSK